ncbi:MAG TPA: hypothetical protein VN541_14700 [Tepidisphaeraceae bacterium]|nr:hypothetical protein [Tepidisphaeraceae bacterium]
METETAIHERSSTPVAPSPAVKLRRGSWVPWVAITAAFTAVVIQYSFIYGKLAVHPFYDDVSYFDDALTRLQQLYTGGLRELLLGVIQIPPHSFFSTFLALIAYLVLGAHDWAPYVANGIIILGLAAIVNWLSHGLPRGQRIVLFLFVLTVPISARAVIEFRPDIASGLCAATGAVMLVSAPLSDGNWKHRLAAGAMFGLAMLFKTPTFPLTLILLAAALGAAGLIDLLILPRRPTFTRLAACAAQCTAIALLVPLPVYLLQFREIFHYIWDPVFGKTNAMWRTPGTRAEHALYYLTGPGGSDMLASHLYLLLAIILAGLIAAASINRRALGRILGLLAVTFVAYSVVAAMSIKQEFFGSTFDWMLILSGVYVLVFAARSTPAAVARVVVVAALALALGITHFLTPLYLPDAPNAIARRRIVDQLYGAMRQQQIGPQARVFITTTGYVNTDVLNYLSLQRGLPAFNFTRLPFSDDLAQYKHEIALADYVIASEQGNSEAYGGFIPSGNIQDQTLALVRANGDFEEVASFPTLTRKRYFLFATIQPFEDWHVQLGMGALEGPYPQWGLGRVRWGYGPQSDATVNFKTGGQYRLVLDAKAAVAGTTLRVLIDGREIGRHLFQNNTEFERFEFPLELAAGEHRTELIYSNWLHSSPSPLAVLFKKAHFVPAGLKATSPPS